jgi:hypothetical protein
LLAVFVGPSGMALVEIQKLYMTSVESISTLAKWNCEICIDQRRQAESSKIVHCFFMFSFVVVL